MTEEITLEADDDDDVDVEGLSEAFDVMVVEVVVRGKDKAGIVSVGVASAARQTGKKFPFISTLVCNNKGPEMSSLLIGLLSGLGGGLCSVGKGSLLLLNDEVGDERPDVSSLLAGVAFSEDFFSECDRLTSFDFSDLDKLLVFSKLPLRPLVFSTTLSDSGEAIGAPLSFLVGLPASEDPESVSSM